jgi:uncharacterized protein YeaO (DUF488 family)
MHMPHLYPDGDGAAVDLLASKARRGAVTLVYAARDQEHNGVLALKEFLQLRKKRGAP